MAPKYYRRVPEETSEERRWKKIPPCRIRHCRFPRSAARFLCPCCAPRRCAIRPRAPRQPDGRMQFEFDAIRAADRAPAGSITSDGVNFSAGSADVSPVFSRRASKSPASPRFLFLLPTSFLAGSFIRGHVEKFDIDRRDNFSQTFTRRSEKKALISKLKSRVMDCYIYTCVAQIEWCACPSLCVR